MSAQPLQTIAQCNHRFGTKTHYPLVSLIRPGQTDILPKQLRFGFYAVWLQETPSPSASVFGRTEYDFTDGTMVFLRPGEFAECNLWYKEGCKTNRLLCFHPSLIEMIKKECGWKQFSFFRYRLDESLHLSLRERMVVEREMDSLDEELRWGIDEHSRTIICYKIALLLDYIDRFYDRQFITRHDINSELIKATEQWFDHFFRSGKIREKGIPSTVSLAERFNHSANYFNDMLKHETGKDTAEFVKCKRIAIAKELLQQGEKSVTEIAAELGFPTHRGFCSLFKKFCGYDPRYFTLCPSNKNSN